MFADLVGKGGHVRTVSVPCWIAGAFRAWMADAKITDGPIFRAINKAGRMAAHGFSPTVIWGVVEAGLLGLQPRNVAPHDLRRMRSPLPRVWWRAGADPVLARAPLSGLDLRWGATPVSPVGTAEFSAKLDPHSEEPGAANAARLMCLWTLAQIIPLRSSRNYSASLGYRQCITVSSGF